MKQQTIDALAQKWAGTDLAMPEGLHQLGKIAWATLVTYLDKIGATYTGGCRAFYSPEEWCARGERYCRASLLVVVYEGGDLSDVVPFGCKRGRPIVDLMYQHGLFIEDGTCWCAGVYMA